MEYKKVHDCRMMHVGRILIAGMWVRVLVQVVELHSLIGWRVLWEPVPALWTASGFGSLSYPATERFLMLPNALTTRLQIVTLRADVKQFRLIYPCLAPKNTDTNSLSPTIVALFIKIRRPCCQQYGYTGCFKKSFTGLFQMLLCDECYKNCYTLRQWIISRIVIATLIYHRHIPI
jgi:hypothetical protein